MKKTMRRQMTVVFITLVVMVVFISLFLCTLFLGDYYVYHKESRLMDIYRQLDSAASQNSLTDEDTILALNQKVEVGNFSFAILPKDTRDQGLTAAANEQKRKELLLQLSGYLMGFNQQQGEVLEKTGRYEIRKTMDVVSEEEYLEMWGTLADGSNFILRSPLESIHLNVSLTTRFLTYVMLVLILLASAVVWLISRRLTDPIMELAELSSRMADLDFDAKYTSGGHNEIGILGENYNRMSERLETAISELKNANYALCQDIEEKDKMEQMRTEFIGNVSHELKTPIALIQGYAEGLKEGVNEDAESREFYCDVIIDEAARMNQLVKNLLTLNQMEFDKESISYSRFDIAELIRGVLASTEILIQQKEAKVQFACTEAVYVWADEFKTEQVVRNYLTNALNHATGEKIVDIRLKKMTEQKVRITVFNTGTPIPEEDLEKIWDKFYKVDKAHTREYGGNGIGLSIVKAIMEAFHCAYGVQNYENGVAFWFELEGDERHVGN